MKIDGDHSAIFVKLVIALSDSNAFSSTVASGGFVDYPSANSTGLEEDFGLFATITSQIKTFIVIVNLAPS